MLFALFLLSKQAFCFKQSKLAHVKSNTVVTERTEYSSSAQSITIKDTSFDKINSTGLSGGAIYIKNSNITATDCQFNSCIAKEGGAIFIEFSTTNVFEVAIQNCAFQSCKATSNGGAIRINHQAMNKHVTINACTFTENSAKAGGAISAIARDLLKIEGCTFNNNIATSTAANGAASLYAKVGNSDLKELSPSFVLKDNEFNYAASENSTNVYIENAKQSSGTGGPISAYIGGNTFSSSTSVESFNHLTIIENIGSLNTGFQVEFDKCNCVKQGSNTFNVPQKYLKNINFECQSIESCAPNVQPPDPDTPDLPTSGDRIPDNNTLTVIDIANATFTNLVDTDKKGGGAICVNSNKVNLTVNKCTFQGCSSANGGAIYVNYAKVNYTLIGSVTNCNFNSNEANTAGGAIWITITQPRIYTFTIDNCNFRYNKAKSGGGVYAVVRDAFTLSRCSFTNNEATTYGSSLYLEPGWSPTSKDKNNTIVVEKNTFTFVPTTTNKINVQIQTKTGDAKNVILTIKGNKFIAPQQSTDDFMHFNLKEYSPYQSVIFAGCNCIQHGRETASFPQSINPITNFSFNCDPNGACTPDEPIDVPTVPTKPDADGYIPHLRIDDEGKEINLKKYKFTEINSEGKDGGAILINKNRVSCTLNNCTFTSCKGQNGGAIYILFAGGSGLTCSIKGSKFTQCEAATNGGAINFQNNNPEINTIEISSCTFTSNKAGKNGGALYLMAGDNFDVDNCVFENNEAASVGSSVWCRVGFNNINENKRPVSFSGNTFTFSPGVNSINVYIENAKINASNYNPNAVVSLGTCRFASSTKDVNTYKHLVIESKGDGFQSILFPDCICIQEDKEKVTLPEGYRDSVFSYNCKSFGSCSADSEGYKYHEKIEDEKRNETINLEKYKFKNIINTVQGGAITINKQKTSLILNNCKFDSCKASMGGAIYILYSGTSANFTCTITNSKFSENEADSNGGAFYFEITQSKRHSVSVTNCEFTANRAGKNGGAIYAAARDRFTLEGCTFSDNYSPTTGVGSSVWLRAGYNSVYSENKVIVRGNKFSFTPINKKSINVHIETYPLLEGESPNANLEFGGNEFIVGSTAVIGYLNLEIKPEYSAFETITFTGCTCVHDEQETVYVPYPYDTRAFNFNCQSSSSCSPQTKPVPSPDGEGYTPSERIQLNVAPSIRLVKSKFTGIESNLTGGAVSLTKVNCTFSDCKFTSCQSKAKLNGNNDGGGAIFIQYSTRDKYYKASIVSCQFKSCETTSQGGALNIKINQAKCHSVSIEGCTFTNNKAANCGGAIYTIARDLLSITHCTFTNNEALNGSSIWAQIGWNEGKDDDNKLYLYNNKFSFTPSETNPINVYIQSNSLKQDIAANANVLIGLCSFEGQNINGENHKNLVISENGAFQSIVFNDCNCLQGEENTVTITSTVEVNKENLKFNCVNMDQCKPGDSEQPPETDECKSYPSHQEIFGQSHSVEKSCFYNLKSTTREGGAARIVNSHIEFENCRFINCSSEKSGGAVYVDFSIPDCEFEIEDCTFDNCESKAQGGALYFSNIFSSESSITKCIFTNNHAASHGGALYYAPCENSILSSCLFVNNSCTAKQTIHGSAVYIFVENNNVKSATSKAILTDDDDDDTSVIISGNKIRSQPTENTQQMYINIKKSGNVKIDANSFSFNGVNVTTASSKYLQVSADEGAAIQVTNKICVDHDGSKKNLISGIDFEVDYDCHKADSDHDNEFDPVPTRNKKSNTGMIVGIVIGVIAAIVIVVVVVVLVMKRKKSEGRYISDIESDGLVESAEM